MASRSDNPATASPHPSCSPTRGNGHRRMLRFVKRASGSLALALLITACGAASRNSALPLAPTPRTALGACLKMALMHAVCPPRVPLLSGHPVVLSAACLDSVGARVPVTSKRCRTAAWSLMGAPSRPVDIAHVVIFASHDDWQCTWPHELRAHAASDRLLNPGRRRAVSLGPARWYGQSGQLVLAPPFTHGGGVVGGHLEFCFRANGVNYAITIHAWPPLAQVIATLKSLVGSALHHR
jgi:hypothetical protein